MTRLRKKVRRRKKIKINQWILPLALILGLAAFVAAAALYRPPQNPGSRLPAAEYFEIINPTTDNAKFVDNRTGLIIYSLQFTLKAVKGPAHEIAILSWAFSDIVDVGDLQQGESQFVEVQSSSGYLTTEEGGGFPVSIRVTSLEAEGEITFYLYL